ncbi:MAG: hypothetical protein DRJ03_02595 [Chloroflexi bacterium]|nr:MAG: hypothetical protein DRJ03_02595 [Chloroflexota bacterium]
MITVGVDTYVTVLEADTYFAARYGYESWALLDEPTKEKALISAAQQLDLQCAWYGSRVDDEQLLAFPRTPDADPVPQAIKDAQCEIAFAITTTGSTSTDGGDPLTELKAGSVTLKFEASSTGNPLISNMTSSMLAPYGLCGGSGSTKLVPMERQ